ncbi:MAG TPA: ABC transporter permease subunit [Candidatus Saccharimonadales bacterium]|nr:ABC transporter permease subunit [Candidatus Saccharimonadales bacterium]
MIPVLRAEFKKLFTIRSTYGWILLALIIVGIFAFYGEGYSDISNLLRSNKATAEQQSLFLAGTITQMANFIAIFGGIISLLFITHEYRYNTITYTLASVSRRSKVISAKIGAIFSFVLVYSVLMAFFGLGMIFLGLHFSGHTLPHQNINYLTYLLKCVFNAEGYALAALLFGTLIRHQAGSFAALFIIPGPVEGLLSLLLKSKSTYLPFMSLSQVIQPPVIAGARAAHNDSGTGYLSAPKGAAVFLVYLVIGWAICWYLFLRRDAN